MARSLVGSDVSEGPCLSGSAPRFLALSSLHRVVVVCFPIADFFFFFFPNLEGHIVKRSASQVGRLVNTHRPGR